MVMLPNGPYVLGENDELKGDELNGYGEIDHVISYQSAPFGDHSKSSAT